MANSEWRMASRSPPIRHSLLPIRYLCGIFGKNTASNPIAGKKAQT
jgi:hypothetical protein